MDTSLIAKILPTKKDGKRTIGTGYPIAKDLILTARHVVIFSARDESKPIVVEWTDYKDALGNIHSVEAEIFFDGGAECDIAILKCQIPPQAQVSSSILAWRFPVAHQTWEGFGYPRIGKDEKNDTREKISVLGKFHPSNTTSHNISLTSESDTLKKEGWCGVSGAPAFSGTILYAVITSTPKNRNECFTAVSIPYLLKNNPDFKAKAQPIDEEAIKKQKQELHNKIKSNITRLLLKNFTEEILREFLKGGEDKPIAELVGYLLVDEQDKSVSVLDSISVITRILKKYPPKSIDEIEEIGGWLLINSVDSAWWFNNEQKVKQATGKFSLKEPDYIDVIISRSFLQPAQYVLDKCNKLGNPKPFRKDDKNNKLPLIIYDAEDDSTDQILLTPIYKDLWDIEPPRDYPVQDLLERIMAAASSRGRNEGGKLIYYLVTQAYLEILESKDWFLNAQAELAGCLRFICCSEKEQFTENPCSENPIVVLAQLKDLLKALENHQKE